MKQEEEEEVGKVVLDPSKVQDVLSRTMDDSNDAADDAMALVSLGIDNCTRNKQKTISSIGERLWNEWFHPIGNMNGAKAASIKQKIARIGSMEEQANYDAFWKLRCVVGAAFGSMLQQVNHTLHH